MKFKKLKWVALGIATFSLGSVLVSEGEMPCVPTQVWLEATGTWATIPCPPEQIPITQEDILLSQAAAGWDACKPKLSEKKEKEYFQNAITLHPSRTDKQELKSKYQVLIQLCTNSL